MRNWRVGNYAKVALFIAVITFGGAGTVMAQTSNSNNYQMTESEFGTTDEACSGRYCAQVSIGDLSDGSKMVSNTAQFGDIIDNEPQLDVIIEPGNSNLGILSINETASRTTKVQVRSYLTGGYTLQMLGDAPEFEGHTLKRLTSPTASKAGTEQFGINVVENTAPGVGMNPVQVPADTMTFGVVGDDYKTPNLFKYLNEDVIARSDTLSGRTDYTVSMIVNISSSTPAGHYTGDFFAVVIPAF